MLTGKTTGRNWPPVRAPLTAVASADTRNWLMPRTRANVVPKSRSPPARTPCAVGGITPPPTAAAALGLLVAAPLGSSRPPVTFV